MSVAVPRRPRPARLDLAGCVTFSGALFLLVGALVQGNDHGWASGPIVGGLVGAAVLLVAFVVVELRTDHPMLDLGLFRRPAMTGVSLGAFTLAGSIFAMFLFLILFMEEVLGLSPLQAGIRFLPVTLLAFVTAPVAGKLTATVPSRVLLGAGLGLVALGCFLMGHVHPDSSWTVLLPGFVAGGIGVGLANPVVASASVAVVEPARSGMASGASGTFRQVGFATSVAACGAVFLAHVRSSTTQSLEASVLGRRILATAGRPRGRGGDERIGARGHRRPPGPGAHHHHRRLPLGVLGGARRHPHDRRRGRPGRGGGRPGPGPPARLRVPALAARGRAGDGTPGRRAPAAVAVGPRTRRLAQVAVAASRDGAAEFPPRTDPIWVPEAARPAAGAGPPEPTAGSRTDGPGVPVPARSRRPPARSAVARDDVPWSADDEREGWHVQTRLTELLGIEHPVMLAGMGGVSYAALVVAVSEAGGFGCLGASTMSTERMVEEIADVRAATGRPFGVDLLTAMPGDLAAQVDRIIEGGATVFVAGLGVPASVVERCHDAGLLVVNMCGKVDHARRARDAGCDVVVAQGTEAGGHTGRVATMPLVPQIVDAVGDDIPVVAAGGIFDGRGLAAALALGADGVWMGTRFIATPEARGVGGYKDALLRTAEDGTTVSRAFSGKTMRVVRNDYTDYYDAHPDELQPFPAQLGRSMEERAFHLGGGEDTPEVDPARECYPAGQGVGAIHTLIPAGRLVAQIVEEAERALARAGAPA